MREPARLDRYSPSRLGPAHRARRGDAGVNDLTIAGEFAAAEALRKGQLDDPFSWLGPHATAHGTVVRTFLPGALAVDVFAREGGEWLGRLQPLEQSGLF